MGNVGKSPRGTLVRSAERFVTEGPGTTTRSLLSTGAHWDADRLAVGPVVAVDEHRIAPGAGFPAHRHAGVDVVTRVVEGELHHSGTGADAVLGLGDVAVLRAGPGAGHSETAGPAGARIVQTWLAVPPTGVAAYERVRPGGDPVLAATLVTGPLDRPLAWAEGVLLVLAGAVEVDGERLLAGDALLRRPGTSGGPVTPVDRGTDVLLWSTPRE